ncbi:uncharacterized protein KY384_005731 [Bacidia gigantensis]|uniref:uncharacterized protein n=1 Tax=Bacidia gigantensis TaxID=2732470 RepID=UPI001D05AA4F|nr:uncharacterized protein KY384_005731 [Bacidia gigantensis]KAG8529096.1 hypothetical protein KY384_005731 [Bacidia gigantensis]
MAYIETPRTDAGNATYMTNGHDFENFSVENSMLSPIKKREDIVALMRNERGASLKTPRARMPLADRRNLPAVPKPAEFTPLLQSVTKRNFERNGKRKSGPETPAFLKAGYQNKGSPALPGAEASALYGSELGSSVLVDNGSTPIPQITSSSAQSTPLAALPKRDATGVLPDQGNLMTLREQETIIDKIEKENFGLKLKIHFLEEALRKAGPGFNEAALKENTDLKVDRVTLQKELTRCRKTLNQAERDLEAYKRHLEEVQAKAKRQQADESLQQELEELRTSIQERQEEVEELRDRLITSDQNDDQMQKLKDEMEDLAADLSERDRHIEERDDEIDRLKSQAKKDSDELDEVYAELESEKNRMQELEAESEAKNANEAALNQAKDDLEDALAAQRKAENDLEELQDEMANKSFTTKGLSRQLEEKANKLQDDLATLREEHIDLQSLFDDKSRQAKKLEDQLQSQGQDADVRNQKVSDQHELLRHDHEATLRKCESLNHDLKKTIEELQNKSEEKDLLHSRHDALTTESNALQKDLVKTRSSLDGLENDLQDERQHAADNDRQLRSEAKDEIDRLSEEINKLQRQLADKETSNAGERDTWEGQLRGLKSQKEKSEEQAAGLQRTIDKLQEVEGTLSSKEMKLQEALESEKERHRSEEAVLERHIQTLNKEVEDKRQELEELRTDLSEAKENVRLSEQEQNILEEKVQALEDEVEVLQGDLEEADTEKARLALEAVEEEAADLREQLSEAQQNYNRSTISRPDQQELQSRLQGTMEQLEEAQVERDAAKSQIEEMRALADDTFKLDRERSDLKDSKLRLESEVGRLRDERSNLVKQHAAAKRELESKVARALSEEARLADKVTSLQGTLENAAEDKNLELVLANEKVQRLERRINDLEELLSSSGEHDSVELSILQKDLLAAKERETEHLRREKAQKDVLRDLKSKVSQLERQAHEAELARLASSPKSSASGSPHKTEIVELQRRLTDAQIQLRDSKTSSKSELKTLQARLAESEHNAQNAADGFDQQREQLEADIATSRQEQESLTSKNTSATQTITRLRTRISSLENELQSNRRSTTADDTIAEERADLHQMLKDAKLQAEDLEVQLSSRETSLSSAQMREKDLRAQLKRVRSERTLQSQKAAALMQELDVLQGRYERALDKLASKQRAWEEERRRVRFAGQNTSSFQDGGGEGGNGESRVVEERHGLELKGLVKQIMWLKAKLGRVERFRADLVHEKGFLGLQVRMFEDCNKAQLDLLAEMGVSPDRQTSTRLRLGDALRKQAGDNMRKPASLKVVAKMVLATCRMRRLSGEWAEQKKVGRALRNARLGKEGREGRGF